MEIINKYTEKQKAFFSDSMKTKIVFPYNVQLFAGTPNYIREESKKWNDGLKMKISVTTFQTKDVSVKTTLD